MPETTSPRHNAASYKSSRPEDGPRKLRSACDACHSAKIRCSGGGVPCTRCERDGVQCHYSYRANLGKPKGSLNKKTLERLRRNAEQQSTTKTPENQADNTPNNQFSGSTGNADCDRTFSVCNPMTTLSSIAPQQQTPLSPASLDDILGNNLIGQPGSSAFPDLPTFEGTIPDFSDSILPQFSPGIPSPQTSHSCPKAQPAGGESDDSDSEDDDSEDEAKKLEAFNIFASACTRKSQHPPSLFPSRHDSFHFPNTMPFPATPDSHPRTRMGSFSCNCFQTFTDQLCQLRAVEQSQYSGMDTMLNHTQLTLASVSQFLQCSSCSTDTQAFFLASMLLSNTLRLNDTMIRPPGTPCPQLEIRIGNYNASSQLSEVVKTVLVSSELGKLKVLLETFGRKVDCLQGEPAYVDFLRYQVRSLERELKRTTKKVGVPDLRAAVVRGG
ncbi:hypothetical protein AOQ84DRAFT_392810 [Glonium stellatum]|uniref:Zn(2)-C6 fungal-type domain-containing protein n=1 Tax=Glonium stellatum TaxID=574774 RepID=A0A8E2JMK1_9PEZI|nr:hypothetical protein AOQ84DRAFT_392810 [Glonium stellatum]